MDMGKKGEIQLDRRDEEVLAANGDERAPIHTTRKRQRKWIGHTLSGDSRHGTIIEGKWMERKQEEDKERCILKGRGTKVREVATTYMYI